jgi:signal transduction histidine kinase
VSSATARRIAIAAAIVIGVVMVLGGALLWRNRSVTYGNDTFLWSLFAATSAAYVVAGVAIVRRAPARVIGWLCLAVAGVLELGLTLTQYGIATIRVHPGSLPAPGLALVVAQTTPLLTLTGIVVILHLFPTGHAVGPRWRPFVVATLAGQTLAALVTLLSPGRITDVWSDELSHAGASAANPLGIGGLSSVAGTLNVFAAVLLVVGAVSAVTSLFVRRRRASPDERRQIRWLTTVAGAAATWIVVMLPLTILTGPTGPAVPVFWLVVTPLVALGPPAAIGIGIVRYRLFDIDVVIRKTVVVTVVGFTLTVLYLAVLALATVGQLSRLVVGVALLVVTFNPVRRAARSIADRVAYGHRASSYEVLSGFSERIAGTYAADDVMPRMAAVLAGGAGARAATVWLRVGEELRPVATAGEVPSDPIALVAIDGDELPSLGQETMEVRHNGELLGAFSVEMPANDPLDDARRALIRDMAAQAGLVLRNVRLIEELRASRQRLVAAQDEERRKLERNLHDGAQQQLVALAVQLKLARQLVDRDAAKAAQMLDSLQDAATGALDDLRDLARGIYPPLLADQGLVAALEGQARKAAVPTSVEAEGIGRYPRDVEAAVYFCSLEALNNVAKYAGARSASVHLEQRNGSLTFRIADDGVGFDASATTYGTGLQGIADRLDAIGATFAVTSRPGHGTTVEGTVPLGTA